MFFAVLFASVENVVKQLPHDISTFEYKATEDVKLTVISPRMFDFVISLRAKIGNPTINYACPVGSPPVLFNETEAPYRFTSGDVEFIVEMKKGEYIEFSYATLLPVACETMKVVSKSPYNFSFDASQNNRKDCVFFTPSAKRVNYVIEYSVEGDSTTNIISVYQDEMVHNKKYASYSAGNGSTSFSSIDKPNVFIFQTGRDHSGFINVSLSQGTPIENAVELIDKATTPVSLKPLGHLKMDYWLPVIGTAPSVLLLVSFAYGCFRIMKKKPIDTPYDK